jgi:hypothetical protein
VPVAVDIKGAAGYQITQAAGVEAAQTNPIAVGFIASDGALTHVVTDAATDEEVGIADAGEHEQLRCIDGGGGAKLTNRSGDAGHGQVRTDSAALLVAIGEATWPATRTDRRRPLMRSYVRRIVAKLGETDVLTYMLPYQTRITARRR